MKKLFSILVVLCFLGCIAKAAEIVANGSTDVILYVVIYDANGDPNETVTVTDLDFFWVETGQALESDTTITACATTSAVHADGTAIHLEEGLYRVDFPDDCFDGGVGKQVQLIVDDVGTSNRTSYLSVMLSPQVDVNTVNGGVPLNDEQVGQAIDDHSADVNSLITSATDIETDTQDIQSRIPVSLVGGKMDSDMTAISGDDVAADNSESFFDGVGYAGTNNVIPTVTTLTGHTPQTADHTANIASILTDTGTTLDTKINDIQGATFSSATDSLEAIRDRGDAAWISGGALTEAGIADAVLDELVTDHDDTPWTVGWVLKQIYNFTR